jgi:DNA-binding NtrC family response regulator
MLRLAVSYGHEVRHFPLAKDRSASLGSSSDNDFVITCAGVSRKHATITASADRVVLRDLGSKNGLVVHGERVREATLIPGDSVHIGRAHVLVERVSTPDVELAIAFEARSGSHPSERSTGEADVSTHSVRESLRWARDAENGTIRRDELLERARQILGSEALVAYSVADGEVIVRSVEGPLPPGALSNLQNGVTADQWATVALPDKSTVAAYLGDPARRREEWWDDFFEHVAVTLYGREPAGEEPAAAVRELIIPDEFISGESRPMRRVLDELRAIVRSDLNILVRGESGTGKELFARIIHDTAVGRQRPFRALNCAAIPADMLEAELFGVRGRVATGVDPRPGLFVEANGGTVFLDEIGDMPDRLQPKVLRVLEEREVVPLGTSAPVKINVRVAASTNRNLEAMIEAGIFRHDLYFRIRGAEIVIPPLRERPEDIAQLVTAFAQRSAARQKKRIRGVSRRALDVLASYQWPGNIRELKNAVERAVARCSSGGTLDSQQFDQLVSTSVPPTSSQRLDAVERDAIAEALRKTGNNISAAAELLGITRGGLYKKMRRFSIKRR